MITKLEHPADLAALERLSADGSIEAMVALGKRYLTVPPFQAYKAIELIISASEKGSAEAAHLIATFAATGAGLPQNWPGAFGYLQRAAERGWIPARRQLTLLCNDPVLIQRALTPKPDLSLWEQIHRGIDIKNKLAPQIFTSFPNDRALQS